MEMLRCLLLPIQGRILILPYSAVAEVVPLENSKIYKDSKDLKLGYFSWRGLQVPLVSMEMRDSNKTFTPQSVQLVAVLNRCSDVAGLPDFIGIMLTGVPSMGRYRATDFNFISEGEVPYLKMTVTARTATVSIPDMEWLEQQFLQI